ncbi:RNA-guided endonuclease InsQ/TnpB family protein [Plectonema radiosum]|uniref:RNA-guided endonuclease InsQ/TnpB family protein n=1 Tax=Plectonema radiosum TaxID=945768 RepID=UPI001D13662E|nr:transposase [Plectonema radiosum]
MSQTNGDSRTLRSGVKGNFHAPFWRPVREGDFPTEFNYFLSDSQGNIEDNPQFYRQGERQLNRLNRHKSKKYKKGKPQSQNYHKARIRYARKHLKVSRQREEFVKKVALRLIQSNDLVAYENLNVKGMVRNRNLAKSITDAGWSSSSSLVGLFWL